MDLAGIPPERHWDTMKSVAMTIERSGYESLFVYDHFHTIPIPSQEVTYEAWTLMAALATVTDTVRLGQMCTCNGYRSPAYLAKIAASVDVISGGRLEMGIGAGWYGHEFDGYGYEFPEPSTRIGQLGEAVEIMRRMWTEPEVDYEGKYYQLQGAICQPKPLQEPHIPLWIAGGGEQLTLKVAARHAQYTNFADNVEGFVRKSDILRKHCQDVGSDFDSITRTASFEVVCEETEMAVSEKLGWIKSHLSRFITEERAEGVLDRYRPMAGTPEQLVDRLGPWSEAGMSYATVYFFDAAHDSTGLERFAREVIPALNN